jgi:hypothetical protein
MFSGNKLAHSFFLFFGILITVIVLLGIKVTIDQVGKSQELRKKAQTPHGSLSSYQDQVEEGSLKPADKIYEVQLSYDSSQKPEVKILNVLQKNGYVPTTHEIGEYTISLVDQNQLSLYQKPFTIPNEIHDPPPLPGQSAENNHVILSKLDFIEVLPYLPEATRIVIRKDTIVIGSFALENIVSVNNTPTFKTLTNPNRGSYTPPAETTLDARTQAVDGFLDIAIISAWYTDMSSFRAHVDTIVNHMYGYEPFNRRTAQIRVHIVENTADLGCEYDTVTTRLLVCDPFTVRQKINNAGVPNDTIYVLVHSATYGGSGGSIAVGYDGSYEGPMFLHESLGHAFGLLTDEYSYGGNAVLDNKVHGLYGSVGDGNCYAGTPPAAAWQGISGVSYFISCRHDNWYRSSPSSIMLTLSDTYFNDVSIGVLNRRMDAFAGPFNPTTTPAVTLTPTPAQEILDQVQINVGLININAGKTVDLSALAYSSQGTPIWDNVSYEWGISSSNSIGRLSKTSGNITTFEAQNAGHGDLYVTATYQGKSVTKSIPVDVVGTTTKPGDTNNDNIVNIRDYNTLVTQFNKTGSNLSADFNKSGKVDVQDYNILVSNFGK